MQMTRPASELDDSLAVRLTVGFLHLLWTAVRVPIVLLLVILEPFVSFLLMGFATLGVLTCLFWKFFGPDPHFPFWEGMAISLGSAMLLLPYYFLIRLFSIP